MKEELRYAGRMVLLGDLMQKSLVLANKLMKETGTLPRATGGDSQKGLLAQYDLQVQVALTLFLRCTKLMPEQDKVYDFALEYLSLLLKEKEAGMERSEKGRAGFATSVRLCDHPDLCQHPGLKALFDERTKGCVCGWTAEHEGAAADRIIEAMTIKDFLSDDVLVCPQCRALLSLEKFNSGELWDESAEASRKAAAWKGKSDA